jgi:hypothetical protein
VVVPCAGRFAIIETIIGAGVEPENIATSDIGIFSSLLGYYITEQDMADLGIHTEFDFVCEDPDDDMYVPSMLLALKVAQIPPKHYYNEQVRKDLVMNIDKHLDRLKTEIDALKASTSGIDYKIMDMFDVFERTVDASSTLLFVDAPIYKGGYTRMFADTEVTWNAPPIAEFDIGGYGAMLEELWGRKATVVSYCYHNMDDVPSGWYPFYARKYSNERTDYLLSNKPQNVVKTDRTQTNIPKKYVYSIFTPTDIISEDSVFGFVEVHRSIAAYYRDLFVHRLGAAQAQTCYLVIVDGKIFAVLGLDTTSLNKGDGYVGQTYGIATYSQRYKSLNRLFMMLITCTQFGDTHLSNSIWDCNSVRTTTFSRTPSTKAHNGIFKIVKKTCLKSGMWKIQHETEFHDKTYADCVKEWLDYEYKRGEYDRNYGKKKKKLRSNARPR